MNVLQTHTVWPFVLSEIWHDFIIDFWPIGLTFENALVRPKLQRPNFVNEVYKDCL